MSALVAPPPAMTMQDVAAAVGLSYGRFRKRWRAMNAEQGFPAPVIAHRWNRAAVEAWIAGRGVRVVALEPEVAPPANTRARRAQAMFQRSA